MSDVPEEPASRWRLARDWIFTVPFLLAFGLLLVVFDPAQRLFRLFGQRPQEIAAAAAQWCIMQSLRVCGTRFTVERSASLAPGRPYLLVSNHQSMFDPAILGGLLFRSFVKYVAKRELARGIPTVSYNLRQGGNAVIDRSDRQQAIREIRALGERAVSWGVAVVLFPEGTRARAGEPREFKPAGFLELLDAAPDVPLVPVVIDNSWKLVRNRLRPVPFGTHVRVRIGTPIPRRPDEDRAVLLRRIETEIRETLDAWREGGARLRRRESGNTEGHV